MIALIENHFLPSIAYFSALRGATAVLVEKHEHYVKQSFRTRCHINTAHGRDQLTVPVTAKHGKPLITEVRIDYSQKWAINHWRTLQSAYGKAPFFEHYAGDLEKILFRRHVFLYDMNLELLSMCLAWLRWRVSVQETLSYTKTVEQPISDFRGVIDAKKEVKGEFFLPAKYYQVFGNVFAENLSLVDLIFCEGPNAPVIVDASIPPK